MLNVECLFKDPGAVTQIAASDTHHLTFTNWERAPGWVWQLVN